MVKHNVYFLQLIRRGEKVVERSHCEDTNGDHLPSLMDYYDISGSKKSLRFFFMFCIIFCSILSIFRFFFCWSSYFSSPLCPLILSSETKNELHNFQPQATVKAETVSSSCSPMLNNTICCDRRAYRNDICYMKGDVRTQPSSNSILLYYDQSTKMAEEKIKPYTRKWEVAVTSTIQELSLKVTTSPNDGAGSCDIRHDDAAIVFSIGGYTGNVYHAFNDGLIPLYITSQRFNKKVVFVLSDYQPWWIIKYGDVVSRLSDYVPIDFTNDRRTHCFPEAIVGLQIHGELTVHETKMENKKTLADFRKLLNEAYAPRAHVIELEELQSRRPRSNSMFITANIKGPKLVIISRNGSREIQNERDLVKLAEDIGFSVELLKPEPMTEMAAIYRTLNSSDAMIGVHGAGLTHFLFMRPGSVFIQIVPLGADWPAATYYGEPAAKMGLWYVGYKILKEESSLYDEYPEDHQVLNDPRSLVKKGWHVTKSVYLDKQNVKLDLERFRNYLAKAYQYLMKKEDTFQGHRQ